MSQKIFVPLPVSEDGQVETRQQEAPARLTGMEARAGRSLHNVKMGDALAKQVEMEPTWQPNAYNSDISELKWRPVRESEPSPEPVQQVNNFNNQGASYMPNDNSLPEDVDLLDPEQMGNYIQRTIQEAISPHIGVLRNAQVANEYSAAQADFGDDPAFKHKMQLALDYSLSERQAGRNVSIYDAYKAVNDPKQAKLGRGGPGAAHLPEQLESAYRTVNGKRRQNNATGLGQIFAHNLASGRAAKPTRKR
jgi:hypothetical protein